MSQDTVAAKAQLVQVVQYLVLKLADDDIHPVDAQLLKEMLEQEVDGLLPPHTVPKVRIAHHQLQIGAADVISQVIVEQVADHAFLCRLDRESLPVRCGEFPRKIGSQFGHRRRECLGHRRVYRPLVGVLPVMQGRQVCVRKAAYSDLPTPEHEIGEPFGSPFWHHIRGLLECGGLDLAGDRAGDEQSGIDRSSLAPLFDLEALPAQVLQRGLFDAGQHQTVGEALGHGVQVGAPKPDPLVQFQDAVGFGGIQDTAEEKDQGQLFDDTQRAGDAQCLADQLCPDPCPARNPRDAHAADLDGVKTSQELQWRDVNARASDGVSCRVQGRDLNAARHTVCLIAHQKGLQPLVQACLG